MASVQVQKVEAGEQLGWPEQIQDGATVTIYNSTHVDMQFITSYIWTGRYLTAPPQTITGCDGLGVFDHVKANELGSKAAVMYTVSSSTGAPCAAVLAWDAPAYYNDSISPNRVWAKCGPKNEIVRLTWDAIETNLDKADSQFGDEDETSKITVFGVMLPHEDTKMAELNVRCMYID